VFQPRGKVLGGSSSINGLLYVRGQHEDFDRWRQHANSAGVITTCCLISKKAEDQQRGADDFHGAGGPLPCLRSGDILIRLGAFIAAAVESGLPPNPDFNGASQEGAGFFPDHERRGSKGEHGMAYLAPQGRNNMHVETFRVGAAHPVEGRRAVVDRIPQSREHANRAGAQGS